MPIIIPIVIPIIKCIVALWRRNRHGGKGPEGQGGGDRQTTNMSRPYTSSHNTRPQKALIRPALQHDGKVTHSNVVATPEADHRERGGHVPHT